MVCREVVDRLSPFLDDELDPVTSREVSTHVAGCAGCAAELARLRRLGEGLRGELEYHRAPDLLRERVMRDARAAGRSDGASSRRVAARGRWFVAAAAALAVAGGTWSAGTLLRDRANAAIAGEVVSAHVRSLMANHLMDVASTDQHTVKPWFAGRVDFSPPVTDFASAGFPLVGGRLDYLEGHPVAALVYMHRRHVINVFEWPVGDTHATIAATATRQGFHVIRGTHAGMACWVVSDLNAEELAAFARML